MLQYIILSLYFKKCLIFFYLIFQKQHLQYDPATSGHCKLPHWTWTRNSSPAIRLWYEWRSVIILWHLPGILRSRRQWHFKQRWRNWWYRWREKELSFIDSELDVTGMLKCQWQMEGGKIRVHGVWLASNSYQGCKEPWVDKNQLERNINIYHSEHLCYMLYCICIYIRGSVTIFRSRTS